MVLTRINTASRMVGMKKQVSNLPIETILKAAQRAGQNAALRAVSAGRRVAGWKDGKLVEYGTGALPLSPKTREEEDADARVA